MALGSQIVTATLGILLAVCAPAIAQTPTEAQQKALRANCPSDFRTHCSGVPTGGMEALVCLEKNVASLSPACKSAVEAVDPSATSSTTSAPASTETAPSPSTEATPAQPTVQSALPSTTAPKPAASSHEPQLTFRQEMAIAAGACAVDFRLFCPNLPVGHGNILFCLRVHGPRLAPACHDALVKAGVPMR